MRWTNWTADWFWAVSCYVSLLAGCFASSLKIGNQDKRVDHTGKPLGRNQPSTWTKSTQRNRAKALKKLGKSERFWPSWRREREGNSLPRCTKENKEKKKNKSKKRTLETIYKYNWISRLFTSLLQVVGWTRLYLFKTLSRFSCVRAYLVYSGHLHSLIDAVEKFCQLLNWGLSVSLRVFQVIPFYASLISFGVASPKHFLSASDSPIYFHTWRLQHFPIAMHTKVVFAVLLDSPMTVGRNRSCRTSPTKMRKGQHQTWGFRKGTGLFTCVPPPMFSHR